MKLHFLAPFSAAIGLGLLAALQYQLHLSRAATTGASSPTLLAIDNARLYQTTAKLRGDLAALSNRHAELEQITNSSETADSAVQMIIQNYQLLSGAAAASGPGVTLTIHRRLEQSELVDLVNVVRGLGAEAIAVNNQRILISTPLDAGRYGDQVTVIVIGNTQTLTTGLREAGGVVDELARANSDQISFTVAATLSVPATANNPSTGGATSQPG